MKIVQYKVKDVKPAKYNPRKISDSAFEGLKESLKKFGLVDPLIVNTRTGVLVGGHQRLKAAEAVGMKTVPVVEIDLSPAEEKALNITLNNQAISGDYSEGIAELLEEIQSEFGDDYMSQLNLDSQSLVQALEQTVSEKKDGKTDDDAVPDIPENSNPYNVKRGQVWKLGKHRLMCGDSTSDQDVSALMNGCKADLLFTDPPYGVSYEGGHNKTKRTQIKNDGLSGENLTGLFHNSLALAMKYSYDHCAFYVWYASGKSVETFSSFADLGLSLRAVIQWYKINSGLGAFMSQYIPNCEPCIYAHKTKKSPQWFGASTEKTVWELKRDGRNEYHPTQKPVELPERAINNSSNENQIVLDLFLGSGSTMIACEKTNRVCYGMELDEHYCSVIIKRWEDFTEEKAELIS